jgi:phosphonate transport system ATP-binding protein
VTVGAPADAVLRVEGLAKAYGDVVALDGVSFDVRPGELVAVLGPSGAGKTTLFRCLTGLIRADAGTIVINGQDVRRARGRDLAAVRRDVAVVFQQFGLVRRLSALHNVLGGRLAAIALWRVLARRYRPADRQLALRCLDTVGLLERAYARADQLSGGQQQRVAIARALAQNTSVVLADEPVASLDPESAGVVLEALRAVARTGVAVVTSLHQVNVALAHADRIIALRAGRVVEDAAVAAFDARAIQQIYERVGDATA